MNDIAYHGTNVTKLYPELRGKIFHRKALDKTDSGVIASKSLSVEDCITRLGVSERLANVNEC